MFIKSGCSSVGRASAFQAEGRGFESRRPLHFSKKGFHPLFAFRCRFTDYPHRGMLFARNESDAQSVNELGVKGLETATCQEGFRGKGEFSPEQFSPRSGEREQGAKQPLRENCQKFSLKERRMSDGAWFESRRPLQIYSQRRGSSTPLLGTPLRFVEYPPQGMLFARNESDAQSVNELGIKGLETATCQEGFRGKGEFSPEQFSPRSGEREQGAKRPLRENCQKFSLKERRMSDGAWFESRRPLQIYSQRRGSSTPLLGTPLRFVEYPPQGMLFARNESDAQSVNELGIKGLETATCQEGFRGNCSRRSLACDDIYPRDSKREQGAKRPPKGNCEKRPNIKKNIFVNFFAARVAQSVERILGKDEVTSSILVAGSTGDFKQ